MGTGKQHALVGKLLKPVRKTYWKQIAALNIACESSCCSLSLSSVPSPSTVHLLSLAAPGTPERRQGDSPVPPWADLRSQNWVFPLCLAECPWHRAGLPVPVWQGCKRGGGGHSGQTLTAKCPVTTVISKVLPSSFHCHTVENSVSIKKENSLLAKQTLIRY